MGKHRKLKPVGAARRQLAIAGIGVVAAGGVLTSQLPVSTHSDAAHLQSNHASGSPTEIPSILSVDGSAPSAVRSAQAPGPDAQRRAAPTPAPPTGAAMGLSRARSTPATTTTATATQPDPRPFGDALAMLSHSRRSSSSSARPTGTAASPASNAGAGAPQSSDPSTGQAGGTAPATSQPPASPAPSQPSGSQQSPQSSGSTPQQGPVQQLLSELGNLDVAGVLGLPPRNTPKRQGTAAQPPHDTTTPAAGGQTAH